MRESPLVNILPLNVLHTNLDILHKSFDILHSRLDILHTVTHFDPRSKSRHLTPQFRHHAQYDAHSDLNILPLDSFCTVRHLHKGTCICTLDSTFFWWHLALDLTGLKSTSYLCSDILHSRSTSWTLNSTSCSPKPHLTQNFRHLLALSSAPITRLLLACAPSAVLSTGAGFL
jgi:hypothetical protein